MPPSIQDIYADVRKNFIYTPDVEQFKLLEDWRSHANEIAQPWRDDCDGFALTCAEVAVLRGIEPIRVSVVLCLTEVGQRKRFVLPYDHMVCLISGPVGNLILDNRQRRAEQMDNVSYKWHQAMNLAERGVWRLVKGE